MKYFLILISFIFMSCGIDDFLIHGTMTPEQKECLREQRERARPQYESELERYNSRIDQWERCNESYQAEFYERWTSCIHDQKRYKRGECKQPVNRCGQKPRRPELDDFVNMKFCR